MIYLCDKYTDIPDHWYPKEPKRRAKINQFLGWYPGTLRQQGIEIFVERVKLLILKHNPINLTSRGIATFHAYSPIGFPAIP